MRAPVCSTRCMCVVSQRMNANASERRVNTSMCGLVAPGLRCSSTLMPSSALNAGQEAGRLDNYCDPHPIQMSIKLFRAWHDPPSPPPPPPADRERGQLKREEGVKKGGEITSDKGSPAKWGGGQTTVDVSSCSLN